MAEAYLNDEKKLLPCAVQLNGEYEVNNVYAGVPVIIGKNGVDEGVINALDEYFCKHELAKVKLLQSCLYDRNDIANQLSKALGAQQVQQIGQTILLYRKIEPQK